MKKVIMIQMMMKLRVKNRINRIIDQEVHTVQETVIKTIEN